MSQNFVNLRSDFEKHGKTMKKVLTGIVVSVAAFLAASCCGQPEIDGKWNILKVNGEDIVVTGDEKPFIEFSTEESKVHGFTGCNIMNGAYTIDGKSLTFGNMATTMMAGPEENMKAESAVLGAMQNVSSVKADEGRLLLLDADRNVVMELGK